MPDNSTKFMVIGFLLLFFLIVIAALFEVVLLGYAFFNADKVECNLGWYTFTSQRSDVQSIMSRDCFENGVRINCSSIPFTPPQIFGSD